MLDKKDCHDCEGAGNLYGIVDIKSGPDGPYEVDGEYECETCEGSGQLKTRRMTGMDEKTLEYMGERVDKGRQIQRDIKNIQDAIAQLNTAPTKYVQYIHHNGFTSTEKISKEVSNSLEKASIEIFEEEIERLKERFAEL